MYNLNKYIAKILKDFVKDENSNANNSTIFSNYIGDVPIEDDEIMVSLDITCLYTNIPIIDTLKMIKDYVNNDDQFTRKTAVPQDKFVDLVNLVLTTTRYHINNLHQNINFTKEEESNGELAFLDTSLKPNNGKISVLVYRKPTHTEQHLHYSSHHQTSCKKSFVSSYFNRAYSFITNKDNLCKKS